MTDQPDAPKPKKRGPAKGTRPSGRRPGSKNKRTLERERIERLVKEREELLKLAQTTAGTAQAEIAAAQAAGKKLMKEIGFEFAQMFAGLAAYYQPYPKWARDPTGKLVNANPNYDEAKFREYAKLAAETARDFASYESPKLSAVMIGAGVVEKIQIEGGMPDDFAAPAPVALPPGTVVTAEDPLPVKEAEIIPEEPKAATG